MFKFAATAVAISALLTSGAMAQTLTKGQYLGVTQYTGLVDPFSICAGLTPVGAVTRGIATVAGLGKYITAETSNPTTAATYNPPTTPWEVGYIQCYYPKIPASGYVLDTTATDPTFGMLTAQYNPGAANPITCSASNGIVYNLSVSNGSNGGYPQTSLIGVEPNPPSASLTNPAPLGTLSPFKLYSGNAAIVVAGTTFCYLSVDQVFQRSGV